MLFDDWSGLFRTAIVGALAYVALVALVRVAGKRTLAKMNAFDLVVTVALGSTLATILLSRDVPLAEGVLAFALLIGLQLALTWLSVRSDAVTAVVKSQPSLVAFRGQPLDDALRRQRVTGQELLQAVRQHGFASIGDTHAVVLETDGTFSVIGSAPAAGKASALTNVSGWEPSGEA